jgi:hypothetical protein
VVITVEPLLMELPAVIVAGGFVEPPHATTRHIASAATPETLLPMNVHRVRA